MRQPMNKVLTGITPAPIMRLSVLSTVVGFVATTALATPSQPLNNLLHLDLSDQNIQQTLLSIMNQLPIDVNVWAMNRTEGIAGVDMKLDVSELSKMGLASVGPGSANAKVAINITVTGLG